MSDTDTDSAIALIDLADLPPKQAAFAILKENGMKTQEAANVLGYKPFSAYNVNAKLNKLKLNNPKIVKDAHNVVKNILKGEAWGCIDKIKDSSALMAASMVYDRFDPAVKQTANLNMNVDISPVDLDRWKR